MSIEIISPRMQKALTDNKEPLVFGDLWLSTLAATIDTQNDFESSVVLSNIDLDTFPGEAQLERDNAYSTPIIKQEVGGSTQSLYRSADPATAPFGTPYFTSVWQDFKPDIAGDFNNIIVKIQNPSASARTLYFYLFQQRASIGNVPGKLNSSVWRGYDPAGNSGMTLSGNDDQHYLLISRPITVAGLFDAEVTVDLEGLHFDAGTAYWFALYSPVNIADTPSVYYNAADAYAGGACYTVTETRNRRQVGFSWSHGVLYEFYFTHTYTLLGDAYFKVQVDGYKPSGALTTKRIDLGAIPPAPGTFQLAAAVPSGTTLNVTLNAYSTADGTTPAWTMSNIEDGREIPAYRYWDVEFAFYSDSLFAYSPRLDMAEVLFPKDRILLRPSNRALQHITGALLSDYAPLLAPPDIRSSELKVMERVASGGSASITLEEPVPDVLQRIVADRPLMNFRLALYVGADVPGFAPSDLCRYFIGIVDKVSIKPRYRSNAYRLALSAKNPVLELKRKAPVSTAGGTVDLATLSIDHDRLHASDSMYDILRGKAAIPARYINTVSFRNAKTTCGYGNLDAGALVVRRSDAAGLPDTRIQSPEEVSKLLAPLAQIIDGYIVEDESSRLKLVLHDPDATAEAAWADEDLVKAGYNAIPIESISDINLGYDDLFANIVYCAYGWDGTGDDWTAFDAVIAYLKSDSAEDFSMSTTPFVSVMEKNMKDVSKWIGPESNYNGKSIASALTELLAGRFAYPPARIIGAVLPVSQFMRTLGSVVTIYSKEYARYGRRGIAESEAVKFMVIKKSYDRGKNRMVFDLLELT